MTRLLIFLLIFLVDFLDAEPAWHWNLVARWRIARGLAGVADGERDDRAGGAR